MAQTVRPIPPNQSEEDLTAKKKGFVKGHKTKRSFSYNVQILILLGFGIALTYFFIRFLEQDVAQSLHFSNHAVYVDPSGY